MDTKKDIGAAVKSKLESFKDTPDDFVWTHIEERLKQKKKRRGLIFWYSGIGLGILILMLWLIIPRHTTIEHNTTETNTKIIDSPNNTSASSDSNTSDVNTEDSTTAEISNNKIMQDLTNKEDKVADRDTYQHEVEKTRTSNQSESSMTQKSKRNISSPKKTLNTIGAKPSLILNTTVDTSEIPTKKQKNIADVSVINEKRSTRAKAIPQADSLVAVNKKYRDTIKTLQQSKRLISEDTSKDSIPEDDQSRWSVTPQVTLSYYGAFNTKTSNNLSLNYVCWQVTE